jgi:valyl-tRNA synthetase
VKITPAHDFNDFEVGKRTTCRLMDQRPDRRRRSAHARINDNEDFLAGPCRPRSRRRRLLGSARRQDRFEARKLIVDAGRGRFLDKIEPHTHMVPHGDRGGVVDRAVSDRPVVCRRQDAGQPAIASVREGRTKFVPKNWEKTYFEWMENIQPWCVSRQLWWGHQIPAWYGRTAQVFVEKTEEEALGRRHPALSRP